MKLLLMLLLSVSALEAGKEQPVYNLTIVDPAVFADYNFWETPAGQAFWNTPEGKAVIKAMDDYQLKVENSHNGR